MTPRVRVLAMARLAIAAFLVFSIQGTSAVAQDDTPAGFFRADRERTRLLQDRQALTPTVVQRPTHLIRRAAPVRGFTRVAPPYSPAREAVTNRAPAKPENTPKTSADGDASPANPANPAVAAPVAAGEKQLPAKPVEPDFFVAVIGDSLGTMLGQGLTEAFADKPDVAILRRARENTGLVRDDYFDWTKGVRDLLATTDKINIAIIMVGSNDRQPLRDAAGVYEPLSPKWKQIYGDRVEAIARLFHDKKIPLVWVGLPVMKNDRFSADMASFNEIYADRAARAGASFVDTWEAFLDDRGQFAAYGPDVDGQFQKLRAGDGVHFTKPGARKLAHFVEGDIRHAIEDIQPNIDPRVAVIPPQPAQPEQIAPTTPPDAARQASASGPLIALPAPAAPADVVIPIKPAAGPVLPLTGPTPSPGGALASLSKPGASGAPSEARALLDRALVQGRPIEARSGRADDFTWPRP